VNDNFVPFHSISIFFTFAFELLEILRQNFILSNIGNFGLTMWKRRQKTKNLISQLPTQGLYCKTLRIRNVKQIDNSPTTLVFYSICHKALAFTNTLAYYRIRTLQIRNVFLSNCPRGGICKTSHDIKMFILMAVKPIFVERKVCYSALFTNLDRWHAGTVSFPLSDFILSQLAFPLSDIMFCLHSE
jgi:hypothetical protein